MVKEFPDEKQRYAVCQSKWKKNSLTGTTGLLSSKGTIEIDFTDQIIAADVI